MPLYSAIRVPKKSLSLQHGIENKDFIRLFGQYLPFSGRRRHHARHGGEAGSRRPVHDRLGRHLWRSPGRTARCTYAQRRFAPGICTDTPLPAGERGGFRPFRHDRRYGRQENYETLNRLAPSREAARKIYRMAEFCRRHPDRTYVPDPYYEGHEGFELVLDMLEDGCEGIMEYLRNPARN